MAKTLTQRLTSMHESITKAMEDAEKAEGGNKAAGTRVRKVMQEVKEDAQKVRKSVMECREE